MKAVKAMAGELHIRDLPGKGCIFTHRPAEATSAAERRRGAEATRCFVSS